MWFFISFHERPPGIHEVLMVPPVSVKTLNFSLYCINEVNYLNPHSPVAPNIISEIPVTSTTWPFEIAFNGL